MKKRSSLWTGLSALFILLLQLTACKKNAQESPGPKQPVNSSLAGFEIKDTLNPTRIDSSFAFNPDGTLASATDVLTHSVMNFSYHNGQRLSNTDYTYVYDANNKLSAIALPAGPLGRDSLLLYPNGYINIYRQAAGTTGQGAALYVNYTYVYGGGNTIPAAGPAGDPYAIIGKGDVYDNSGNVTLIYTDSIRISYVSTFNMAFTPLMTICNDPKVHFLNLRLWCNVPIMTTSCIAQIARFTFNNVHIPGHGPVITSATDNFTYEYDSKYRPVWILKNNIPAYSITYHD